MSLDQLCGLCGVLNIPFVVIVQPHLLKDKGAVRLRPVFDLGNEQFISIASLSGEILDRLTVVTEVSSSQQTHRNALQDRELPSSAPSIRDMSSNASPMVKIECFYVDSEHYIAETAKHESRSKAAKKALKTASQRAEAYLSELTGNSVGGTPVFAVDLPLRVLREYGTCLMESGTNVANTRDEISQKYPKHKRVLKTLSSAIDNFLRRRATSNEKRFKTSPEALAPPQPISMFLYSTSEDRFDLVSVNGGLSIPSTSGGQREETKDFSVEEKVKKKIGHVEPGNRNAKC